MKLIHRELNYNFLIFSLCCCFWLKAQRWDSTNKQIAQHETAWNEIIFLIAQHKVFITAATAAQQRRKFTFVYRSLSNLGMPQAPKSAHILQPIKQPPENMWEMWWKSWKIETWNCIKLTRQHTKIKVSFWQSFNPPSHKLWISNTSAKISLAQKKRKVSSNLR